jgi:uncharacterized protein YodC (DUF2158 family)
METKFKVGDRVRFKQTKREWTVTEVVPGYRLGGGVAEFGEDELELVADELFGFKVGDIVLYRAGTAMADYGVVEALNRTDHTLRIRWLRDGTILAHGQVFLRNFCRKG